MKASEFVTEAVMSVGIQSKYPVSAGARGLMGARFRYDRAVDQNVKESDKNAVDQLEHNLKYIPEIHHDGIQSMVQHVSETFRIEPQKLHSQFVKKFNCSPVRYAVQYRQSREGQPIKI
jgi:hypothetical protein